MGDPKDLKEQRRVQALKELGVLDTPPQAELDDLVYLASQVCHTPMAMISLVDERRQWFKAKVGIEAQELPREGSFSAFVIQDGATLIIADATTDPRFAQSPSVTSGLKIKFYAGVPLTTSIGLHIGSLCVMDKTPRTLSKEQTQALEALARQVMVNFENKVLNDQFRENENFYSNILTMLPDLVSYIDRDYCYQYANVAYEEWFHVKKEQIIGKKMSLILGDEAFEKAKPFMTLALQGRRQDFTVKLPYKVDQQLVPKTVQAHYIPDVKPDGSVQGFYSVVSDISKLVSAEEEAHQRSVELAQALSRSRANERSFRAFFDHSPMGVIELDEQLKFIEVNPAYCRILGYSQSELKNMSILDVTHPEDRVKSKNAAKDNTVSGGEPFRFEKRYITRTGEVIMGRVTSRTVVLDEQGTKHHFSVIEDITNLLRMEDSLALERQKSIHNAKLASLGEMSAGVAHEINNPLAIISGMAANLERVANDPENLKSKVKSIQKAVDRIVKIVSGLRKFARTSENGNFNYYPAEALIKDSMVLIQAKALRDQVDVQYVLDRNDVVFCDEVELQQVLVNLMSNGIDAAKQSAEKKVIVHFNSLERESVFRVMDSGPGIKSDLAHKIFQPFFTTKTVGEGTGLGLSISKGIVDHHQGNISLIQVEGKTCFEVRIPKREVKSHVA